MIPGYPAKIKEHYADLIDGSLEDLSQKASLCAPHQNFGLIIEFDQPVELPVYDQDKVLDETLRTLIAKFGPLILRNAYMSYACRSEGQRNIFPDLSFHIDRGNNQEGQYSLFCRDPFDPVQREPRDSSTLIVGNLACYL